MIPSLKSACEERSNNVAPGQHHPSDTNSSNGPPTYRTNWSFSWNKRRATLVESGSEESFRGFDRKNRIDCPRISFYAACVQGYTRRMVFL